MKVLKIKRSKTEKQINVFSSISNQMTYPFLQKEGFYLILKNEELKQTMTIFLERKKEKESPFKKGGK